jgi:hypothetical protein
MNLAILRAVGESAGLENLLALLQRKPDSEWKEGESRRRGGVYQNSGFTLTLSDAATPHNMIVAVRRFLTECDMQGTFIARQGLSVELSIGITVGDSRQFVASVDLNSDDLSMMSRLGLGLSVTAYPTSDYWNADSDDT